MGIRPCRDEEQEVILAIINTAAAAYRGVIPPDRWQEPYMESSELEHETGAGVRFWGFAADGELIGVMGIQPLRDLDLIRHAYVLPDHQRRGVGAALLRHLRGMSSRRTLVGTWEAAEWAIRFYRRHGFELVPPERKSALLKAYWTIPRPPGRGLGGARESAAQRGAMRTGVHPRPDPGLRPIEAETLIELNG